MLGQEVSGLCSPLGSRTDPHLTLPGPNTPLLPWSEVSLQRGSGLCLHESFVKETLPLLDH